MTIKRAPVSPNDPHLVALRNILGEEAVEDALKFFPTPERETEAQRMERERIESERTAEAMTARDTRDEILAGKLGADAKTKLQAEITERGNPDSPAVLRMASLLAAKERKADYYRRLNATKKTGSTP